MWLPVFIPFQNMLVTLVKISKFFRKNILNMIYYTTEIKKSRVSVVWWRTRDTRTTCHNSVTAIKMEHFLNSSCFLRSKWYLKKSRNEWSEFHDRWLILVHLKFFAITGCCGVKVKSRAIFYFCYRNKRESWENDKGRIFSISVVNHNSTDFWRYNFWHKEPDLFSRIILILD